MNCLIINRTPGRVPRAFTDLCVSYFLRTLAKRKIKGTGKVSQVVIVFLSVSEARQLNRKYRKKDYATDVLSFAGTDDDSLGELVISLDVVRRQAREHHLGIKEELSYLILHGLLHLLGFEHEKSERDAQRMFKIQDEIWEKFCQRHR
ncbi:MAG: rRNA maturation RNase YbeY [Bdellovibrionales bacterium]|nr:rRNA maturation RNase YbeY [Bdellovibrionales bacterium]